MVVEIIMGFVIMLIVAGVMLGIGISQYKSTKPVGFYSGEKTPLESELTDVIAWNKKHGKMWICYGVAIMSSYILGVPLMAMGSVWCVVPMCGGVILPLPVMIRYHHKLIRMYKNMFTIAAKAETSEQFEEMISNL